MISVHYNIQLDLLGNSCSCEVYVIIYIDVPLYVKFSPLHYRLVGFCRCNTTVTVMCVDILLLPIMVMNEVHVKFGIIIVR